MRLPPRVDCLTLVAWNDAIGISHSLHHIAALAQIRRTCCFEEHQDQDIDRFSGHKMSANSDPRYDRSSYELHHLMTSSQHMYCSP